MQTPPKISLAAVPYFWSQQDYRDFYSTVATSPVDIVYLGETVCAKRRSMKTGDWLELAQHLSDAGKQVVLSTMTLIEADSELKALGNIASQRDYLIEANDMAAVQVAQRHGNAFVAGSAINVYNNRAIRLLQRSGMTRWCVPVELGGQDIAPLIEQAHALDVEVEYQVFGRMSLAWSARCFTARHHHLPKDDCQFKCLDYEQGIRIKTQEGDDFAQINGIQTQSARVSNLLRNWPELQQAGIDILRIVPVAARDTLSVIDQMAQLLQQEQAAPAALKLRQPYEFCNGYWFGEEGMRNRNP